MSSFYYAVLLLLLLHLPTCLAACSSCHGEAPGCSGSYDNCPWVAGVAANVTAIGAMTALKVTSLLPTRLLRLFPRAALESIVRLSVRATTTFDFAGKSNADIITAVKNGKASRDEALEHAVVQQACLPSDADATDIQAGKNLIKALECMKAVVADTTSSLEGAHLYVLYKLSQSYCATTTAPSSFDFSVCHPSTGEVASELSGVANSSFSAKLVRPPRSFG